MQLIAERQGRISPLPTLLSRQSLLSESSTQTDSLSIPSTCDLSTQTELSDSDESGNLVEPTSSSSELSISSSLPQTSSSSSSSSPSSSSSSSGEEGTVEVSRRSRSGPAEKGKLSVNSVHSCGLELEKREKEVPKRENSEEERSSMAYLSVSKFNDISNGAEEGQINQPPLIPPLTLRVQTEGKLRESKENFEKFIQTNDWLGHSMDDEVDGAIKNASCGSSAIQNYHPCYSSTGSAEPPFQGEGGLSDNLPRVTDQVECHGGAAASTSWCNDVTNENRRNRERKVDSKSLKISQEGKNKSKEHLSGRSHNTTPRKSLGIKGGGQDSFFSNRSLGYENFESVINWNDKDAKPERVRPRDDMRNTIESNFFGIRPCFLARHTDDSGITSPIDDMGNTAENADGGSSNIFSRHQGSSCFTTEQGYQVTYSFQAPSFHSESSKVSANAQGTRNLAWETRTPVDQDTAYQGPLGVLNETSSLSNDDSLADLERRVTEACSLVEKTLKIREVKEKAMKEEERRRKEERARKEQQARERREREASETRQTEHKNDREEVSNPMSGGGGTPTQTSAGAEGRQWLCEHYRRLCRVKFPCCGKFFPCHRCHNNSGCPNDNSKAREACYVECSVCSHQQEVFRHIIY